MIQDVRDVPDSVRLRLLNNAPRQVVILAALYSLAKSTDAPYKKPSDS